MQTPTDGGSRQPRDGYGRFAEDPDAHVRDAEAMRLRAKGATFDEIAVALGYANKGHAQVAIKRHLDNIVPPAADEYRRVMDAQLDEMQRRVVAIMDTEHFTVSHGQLVYHPDDDEYDPNGKRKPLLDDAPVLASVDRWLKIQARRAALWGLDAPTQQRLQVQNVRVTVDGAEDV